MISRIICVVVLGLMVTSCVAPTEEQAAPVCDPAGTYHLTFTRDPDDPGTCASTVVPASFESTEYIIENNGSGGFSVAKMTEPYSVTSKNNNCLVTVSWVEKKTASTATAQMIFDFATPQGAFLMSYVDAKTACTAFYKMNFVKK